MAMTMLLISVHVSGVAKRIPEVEPGAIYVHYFAHFAYIILSSNRLSTIKVYPQCLGVCNECGLTYKVLT